MDFYKSIAENLAEFGSYKTGDRVVATCDFFKGGENIIEGTEDVIESMSSNHHGGWQMNLKDHGRGWSNHVWRRQ